MKYKFKCNHCGHEFSDRESKCAAGPSCPKCNKADAMQLGIIKAVYLHWEGRSYDTERFQADLKLVRRTIGDAPLFTYQCESGCIFATNIPVPGDEVDFNESHGGGRDGGYRIRMRDYHEALRASDDDEVPEVELTEPKHWTQFDHLADWLIESIGQFS